MKLSHLTIFFIIIILPFSIAVRNNMNNYFINLKDQTRLNNVIDIATGDALETLVELNDEFQMLYINERFDITQRLAEEAVESFFKTLAVNYNMPYIEGYTQSYFSVYVPAIVIVAYDGFFIYSVDDTGNGYAYNMSPKIPYSYVDPTTDAIINFTLGNYIKMFTDGRYFEGEFTEDYYVGSDLDDDGNIDTGSKAKYNLYYEAYGGASDPNADDNLYKDIAALTNDMSVIVAAMHEKELSTGNKIVPSFLIPPNSSDAGAIPFLRDYDQSDNDASAFHKKRREVIINIIRDTLRQEINSHQTYAKIMGSNYNFSLPEIANDDWTNSINDISVMSFIQGMPIGVNAYYNNYALGGSRIVQTDYIYATADNLYHSSDCKFVSWFSSSNGMHSIPPGYSETDPEVTVENIFVNRTEAAEYFDPDHPSKRYYPCLECRP